MIEGKEGKIHRLEDWGRRQLAYPINKLHKAHYILFNIECSQETVGELNNAFKYIVQVINLARSMRVMQEQSVWIVGTSLDTEQILYDVDLSGSIAIVLGSEEQGIRNLTAKHYDYLVKLPLLGGTESLNVSVATGICLYEAVRQRLGN